MTEEERLLLEWHLWLTAWLYAGTQDHRRELLEYKTMIERATGWEWCAPYSLANPPKPSSPDVGGNV